MSDEGGSISGPIKVLIILAILVIGWNLYTGATIQEIGIPGLFTVKFGKNGQSVLPPKTPVVGVKKYLMDNHAHRIIILTHLQNNKYRIEEPSSPWPWEGTATIDGGKLIGNANFRNSLASMRVEGVVRGDESIEVKYKFITGSDGKPSAGRVDNHVWFRSN